MFISLTRQKILNLFFDHPELSIHQREISRQAKVVPHNVNKYLKEFVRDGLLTRRKISNLTLFRINPENSFLFKVFEQFELGRKKDFLTQNKNISRLLCEYTENLLRLSNREIQMILLFGSVARGKWTKKSDIDVLVITAETAEKRKIIQVHKKAVQEVDHILEISPIHITIEKFIKGIRDKLEFFEELWRDRIVLYNEFLFWQLIKESKF